MPARDCFNKTINGPIAWQARACPSWRSDAFSRKTLAQPGGTHGLTCKSPMRVCTVA
jgi:hypothetical protein